MIYLPLTGEHESEFYDNRFALQLSEFLMDCGQAAIVYEDRYGGFMLETDEGVTFIGHTEREALDGASRFLTQKMGHGMARFEINLEMGQVAYKALT